jgi:predicted NUDIX family NTP pyrophosphohydrolase
MCCCRRFASDALWRSQDSPPRSGRRARFPEVDRAEWFPVAEARRRILPGQAPLIDRLLRVLGHPG